MSNISMLSEIIRGKAMSCCFLGIRTFVASSPCNVARGLVGSCVITIKRQREWAGKSRTMPVRLLSGRTYPKADALLTMMIADELTGWPPLIFARTDGRSGDQGPGQRSPQIKFTIEETGASDQFFDLTRCRLLRCMSPLLAQSGGPGRACPLL